MRRFRRTFGLALVGPRGRPDARRASASSRGRARPSNGSFRRRAAAGGFGRAILECSWRGRAAARATRKMTSAVTVAHDVSESPLSPKFVTEHVLHLPPFLTKSIYPTLLGENVAPRAYHLEGRFGSRTHKIDRGKNGIPILFSQTEMEELGRTSNDLRELLLTEGVEVVEKAFVHNHRSVQTVPVVDSRIHPELEP
ncbi:hypothetical protein THAOC_30157, partial [Thalassiosira oceanica]